MSKSFAPLTISKIVAETSDANTFYFEAPTGDSFKYKPGQYLTLKADIKGESIRRAYSLCTSPLTDSLMGVTVKRVDQGRMSNYLPDNLKAGDTLEVFPPMGNFCLAPDPNKANHYVLIGGGSGITPLMSIIKSVLEVEKKSKITLLYANRDENSIIFRSLLNELTAAHPQRLKVVYSLDNPPAIWNGIEGLLSRQKQLPILQGIISMDALPKTFWICGPAALMEETQSALHFLNVNKANIKRELFTAPLPDMDTGSSSKTTVQHAKKLDTYTIEVVLDGESHQVTVPPDRTVLEQVIEAGIDPPYACQMGVCTTCRAKLLSGHVEMEEDEGLSDQEIQEGYILTCQSHPLTPDVKLEYM